jgi:(p)ppGpp synthase/HD superfamily hydrolase
MTTSTGTLFTDRFAEACAEAVAVHGREFRKGTTIPYLSHPLAVASIAIDFGADEDQAIAALLHDAVEDGGGQKMLDRLRKKFGNEVARIVDALSDAKPAVGETKPPWWKRKVDYLDALCKEDAAVALVCAADKLHNLRAINADYLEIGPELWGRFATKRRGTLWYYGRLAEILPTRLTGEPGSRLAALIVEEYRKLIEQITDDPREATDAAALDAELVEARRFESEARKGIDPEPRDEGKL